MPYKDPIKQKEAQHRWYLKNKRLTRERDHLARVGALERNKEYLRRLRSRTPCADCGKKFHFSAMDFDHVSGTKIGCLSELAGARVRLERLKEEAAKCEIVCANCHRVRTWKRRELKEEMG